MKLILLSAAALVCLSSCCRHCYGTGTLKTEHSSGACWYCGGDGGWFFEPGSSGFQEFQ